MTGSASRHDLQDDPPHPEPSVPVERDVMAAHPAKAKAQVPRSRSTRQHPRELPARQHARDRHVVTAHMSPALLEPHAPLIAACDNRLRQSHPCEISGSGVD